VGPALGTDIGTRILNSVAHVQLGDRENTKDSLPKLRRSPFAHRSMHKSESNPYHEERPIFYAVGPHCSTH
jgi:hypothetical protein